MSNLGTKDEPVNAVAAMVKDYREYLASEPDLSRRMHPIDYIEQHGIPLNSPIYNDLLEALHRVSQ